MKVAIVTGASSGMGREFVRQLNRVGKRTIQKDIGDIDCIWMVARRTDRLSSLERLYGNRVLSIAAELTTDEGIDEIKKLLSEKRPQVTLLVNSAGMGVIGAFDKNPAEDALDMLNINITALTRMTHAVLPYMKDGARIINLASSAAFLPQPNFAVYAASKSYVLSFSRSLNRELKKRGISVTAVCPGPVKTEFFDIAEQHQKIPLYKKLAMAKAGSVVRLAIDDASHRRDMSVYSWTMKCFLVLSKLLPHGLLLKFF